eukprot:m.90397 g.90397  ORF g.90397 m.90397 type:complete len:105 (-) comp14881_c0_seq2:1073-1387(-)
MSDASITVGAFLSASLPYVSPRLRSLAGAVSPTANALHTPTKLTGNTIIASISLDTARLRVRLAWLDFVRGADSLRFGSVESCCKHMLRIQRTAPVEQTALAPT